MTLIGVVVSILGAKLCLHFNRNQVIGVIGLGATLLAIFSALFLNGPLWPAILLILLYYVAIMMDSGALTAGVVKESDNQNRGSILAAYSMFGFIGSTSPTFRPRSLTRHSATSGQLQACRY